MSTEILVDEVIREDLKIRDTNAVWLQEADLFKKAIIQQQELLLRTPSEAQVRASWKRWKRERHLDAGAEPGIDISNLYGKKK